MIFNSDYELSFLTCFVNVADIAVRLQGGGSYYGRVEVRRTEPDGTWSPWGTVCDDGWSNSDASVACRQLGFKWGQVGLVIFRLNSTLIMVNSQYNKP